MHTCIYIYKSKWCVCIYMPFLFYSFKQNQISKVFITLILPCNTNSREHAMKSSLYDQRGKEASINPRNNDESPPTFHE